MATSLGTNAVVVTRVHCFFQGRHLCQNSFNPSEKGSSLNGIKLLPKEANSFLLEWILSSEEVYGQKSKQEAKKRVSFVKMAEGSTRCTQAPYIPIFKALCEKMYLRTCAPSADKASRL